MTILNIAGLDVGNDEELHRVLQKIYGNRKQIGVLVVSEKQLEFIGDCYEVYGIGVQSDNGNVRQALFFDPGYNEIELRLEDDETNT
jgi:hypothetical protein